MLRWECLEGVIVRLLLLGWMALDRTRGVVVEVLLWGWFVMVDEWGKRVEGFRLSPSVVASRIGFTTFEGFKAIFCWFDLRSGPTDHGRGWRGVAFGGRSADELVGARSRVLVELDSAVAETITHLDGPMWRAERETARECSNKISGGLAASPFS